jgi:integrase/recombinase XerC
VNLLGPPPALKFALCVPISDRVGGIIGAYRLALTRRGLAPKTVNRRCTALLLIATHLSPLTPFEWTAEDIHRFLDARKLQPQSRYRWISNLHVFYGWAIREGLTAVDPTVLMDRPALPRYKPRPISEGDLAMAVEAAPATMRAWLMLAGYAGFRASEVAGLERGDILEGDGLLIVRGKGTKERLVPMRDDVHHALRMHGLPRNGLVFTRPDGTPWPGQKVSLYASRYLHDLGIEATLHQLRHRFATKAYQACSDIRVVQELLGHASPTTTAVYAAWDQSRARAAVALIGEPAQA